MLGSKVFETVGNGVETWECGKRHRGEILFVDFYLLILYWSTGDFYLFMLEYRWLFYLFILCWSTSDFFTFLFYVGVQVTFTFLCWSIGDLFTFLFYVRVQVTFLPFYFMLVYRWLFTFLFYVGVQVANSAVLVSGGQQSDSVSSIHGSILFPLRLLHNREQGFLRCTVGPCWLSILSSAVCICWPRAPDCRVCYEGTTVQTWKRKGEDE